MINKYAELEKMSKIYKACSGILRVKLAEDTKPESKPESKPKRGSKWDSFRYNFNKSRAKTRNFLNRTVPVEGNESGTADALEDFGKLVGDTIRARHNFNRSITDTIGDTLYELPGNVINTTALWGRGLGRAGKAIGEGLWSVYDPTKNLVVDAINGTRQFTGQLAGRAAGALDRGLAGIHRIGSGALNGVKDVAKASLIEPSVEYGKSWYHHPITSLASLGLGGAAGYGTYKGLEKYLRNHGWDDNSWKTKALKWGGGIGAGLLTHLFTQGVMNRMADRAQGRVLGAQDSFNAAADKAATDAYNASKKAREANNFNSDSNNPNNSDPLASLFKRMHAKKKNDSASSASQSEATKKRSK